MRPRPAAARCRTSVPRLELGPDLVVTGTGFIPGECIAVLVKTIGSAEQTVVDQNGSFRMEIGPLGAGVLSITATGDRGSRATLVLPRPSRLH
jgi:hypothetical protein